MEIKYFHTPANTGKRDDLPDDDGGASPLMVMVAGAISILLAMGVIFIVCLCLGGKIVFE